MAFQGAALVWPRRALSCPHRLSSGQCGMQAAAPAGPERRLRSRARLLVHGIDAASAAALNSAQTGTRADAGRFAPRMQADRQSTLIVTGGCCLVLVGVVSTFPKW